MYPARISAYVSAMVLYANKHFPHLPLDILIPSVLIMIGFGEYAQRTEDRKTVEALYIESEATTTDDAVLKKICYNKPKKKAVRKWKI
jgi:hypothetical protein